MKKYLLDTNIVISMFRNRHNVRERILKVGIENAMFRKSPLPNSFTVLLSQDDRKTLTTWKIC